MKINPIAFLWNGFMFLSGIWGLSAFAESTTPLEFVGWIQSLVFLYQDWVYPVFEFLFGWLPFQLPTFVYDYLYFGVVLTGAWWRVYVYAVVIKFWVAYTKPHLAEWGKLEAIWRLIYMILFNIFVWPFTLFAFVLIMVDNQPDVSGVTDSDKLESRTVLMWLGALILCTFLLVFVNFVMIIWGYAE